MLLDH
jgi:hypothetical protein